MFLSKRKASGYYYLHYRDIDGKPHSISTRQKKKTDALRFLREFKEIDIKQNQSNQPNNIPFQQFKAEYLEFSLGGHTLNTHLSARSALNEFERFIGLVNIGEITSRDVEKFIAHKKLVSSYTARRCFSAVKAAFEKAREWKYLRENPFLSKLKPKVPEVEPLFFSKDEFQKLLAVIDNPDWRDFVQTAVLTGARLSELINMRWQYVDLKGRIIHITNNNGFVTKSKRNRIVPMNDTLHKILSQRSVLCEYVFYKGCRQLDKYYVSKRFKKYVRASGVNERLHFHSLRHTCASWAVQAGVSIYQVQHLLGHSSVSTTERYSHLQPSNLVDAVNRISFEAA
jgi:integrase/recombinase XerC